MPLFALFVIVLLLMPSAAAAAGLPAEGVDAQPIAVPGGQLDYQTVRVMGDTRLVESARYGGALRARTIRGPFSIPAVALDGSATGLSADGRTLILISQRRRFPRELTTFAVVDTKSLRVTRRLELRGDFSVDAISPDGATAYLIEYSSRDYTNYDVRAYDLRAGRLFSEPVVDPDEADEPMTGVPVTRLPSPDGRWAYTLYQSAEHPFVHALDTQNRTAVCVDLDDLGEVWNATLSLRGPWLDVRDRRARLLASIDTRTHGVAGAAAPRPTSDDASTSWLPVALPAAALLLLAAALRRRRVLKRERLEPITEAWEPNSDRHAPTV
jgi:hypothetical protein